MIATMIRAVLVDDEPLARRRLRAMLSAHGDVEVIAECEQADDAINVMCELKPDLVFLDIQMPGADGFEVVERAQVTPAPFVIFVTAFAHHAVRAFDADAVDYLLKPFDAQRLARSLGRAREAIAARNSPSVDARLGSIEDMLRGTLEQLSTKRAESPVVPQPTGFVDRIAVTVGRRTLLVKVEEVSWIEASGNYVCLHTRGHQYLVRTAISTLERQLDPSKFARVHRSAIVQIDQVRELRGSGDGDYKVVLADGTILPMSARYREQLKGR